jgi:plasmid stabilization system protein ParE
VTVRVRLTPEAEADIAEAYTWYEDAQTGIGDRFLEAIDEQLRWIGDWPEASPVVHQAIRRSLVRQFPYGLFYIVEDDELIVLGCFHARRDPSGWERRTRHDSEP